MMKLDLIDKKIICALDENCRTPLSFLAKKLRIGRNVADYRIRNLEKAGIIRNYICSVNLGLLGYKTYKIYLKMQSLSAESQKEFECEMTDSTCVIHCLKTEGTYDYSITVAAHTILELDDFLMDIKSRFKHVIREYYVSIVAYSKVFKLQKLFRLEKQKDAKSEKYSGEETSIELDQKDKLILKILAQDARCTMVDISKKTGFSLDIIKYRMKTLGRLVNAYRVIIDFEKLGYYHYVFLLKMRKAARADERKLTMWCLEKQQVLYCTKRIGQYDFEVNAAITGIDELNRFVSDLKTEFGSVIDSYDLIINSKLIKLNYVPF